MTARASSTYRVTDQEPVTIEDAKAAWAEQAREPLIEVAKQYHAVITYKELAEAVQERSGIRTSTLMTPWMSNVLGRVAEDCERRSEPSLSSLVVNQEGSVGEGYRVATTNAALAADDKDLQAAHERLACYRHFGAEIPADGGRAALTPKVQARRDRYTAQQPVRRGEPCPRCFVELPVSGVCFSCS